MLFICLGGSLYDVIKYQLVNHKMSTSLGKNALTEGQNSLNPEYHLDRISSWLRPWSIFKKCSDENL